MNSYSTGLNAFIRAIASFLFVVLMFCFIRASEGVLTLAAITVPVKLAEVPLEDVDVT